MRTTGTYHIDNYGTFKKKLLEFLKTYRYFSFLESNNYAEDKYASFQCLIAFGEVSSFTLKADDPLEACEALNMGKEWLFGFLSYELKNKTENLDTKKPSQLSFPNMFFFRPSYVIRVEGEKAYLETDESVSEQEALQVWGKIMASESVNPETTKAELKARVNKEQYVHTVGQLKEHISKGNVYEVTYCMEFYVEEKNFDPYSLYLQLIDLSPTPFAGIFKYDDQFILSASPERFLRKTGNRLISQPIKGTIKRGSFPEEDLRYRNELKSSGKERSENVMIVDLVRNDLSKIAVPGTVKVDELFGIYGFQQVNQMISTVSCEIQESTSFKEILQALFPMGSMTGAPKHKALQLIDEYETIGRGIYSGSIGYLDPQGNFDLNVLIRSIFYDDQKKYLSFSVGSAITQYCEPEAEYEECLLKARGIMQALGARLC